MYRGRASFISAALLAGAAHAQGITPEIDEPRAYGHVVGDLIEREVHLQLPAGSTLAADALPRPGRAGPWLELRRVEPRVSGQRVDLHLTYQLINAPQKVTTIALPAMLLRSAGAVAGELPPIGEWPVTVSPLTPEFVLARGGLEAMQPDIVPRPEPAAPLAGRLALWLLLCVLAGYALAARRWPALAFWRREAPFRDALADLRRIERRGGPSPAALQQALRRMHAAFDASAGCALFADRLGPLYAARPQFAALAGEVEAFYAASRRVFFADDGAAPAAAPELAQLLALARRLAQREGERARSSAPREAPAG